MSYDAVEIRQRAPGGCPTDMLKRCQWLAVHECPDCGKDSGVAMSPVESLCKEAIGNGVGPEFEP
jgi:hypothetical protein